MIRCYRRASLLALCLLLLAPACVLRADSESHARDPYALLFGTVYGPNDLPAYGVKITIRRADQKKPKWELTSDHQGEFAQRVPAGKADYVIAANVKTSKGVPKPEVTVHVEKDERKDFVLHVK
jgi:hypothetical protein